MLRFLLVSEWSMSDLNYKLIGSIMKVCIPFVKGKEYTIYIYCKKNSRKQTWWLTKAMAEMTADTEQMMKLE